MLGIMELTADSSQDRFSYYRRMFLNMGGILLGDALALLAAILLAGLVRYILRESHIPPSRALYLIPLWAVGAIIFKIAPPWGIGPIEELRRIQVLLLVIFGMRSGGRLYFEIALVLGALSFVSTLALAKFLMRGEVIE